MLGDTKSQENILCIGQRINESYLLSVKVVEYDPRKLPKESEGLPNHSATHKLDAEERESGEYYSIVKIHNRFNILNDCLS